MNRQFSFIIETVAFLSCILLVGYVQGNTAYIGYNLHPFYVVILLITMRYGYVKGLYSSLIAGGLYLFFYFISVDKTFLAGIREHGYFPIAFVAFGMFVGLLAELDKKKISSLGGTIAKLNERLSRREEETLQILSINAHLSDQLATSEKTFNILFQQTKNFYSEDIVQAYKAAYTILKQTIKATKAYCFSIEGNDFRLVCPMENEGDGQVFLRNNREKIEEIRKKHECIRIETLGDDEISDMTPVLLGPIIHYDTDTIYGLLAIEEIDFLDYNENTFLTFKNLCKWLGDILYFRTNQLAPITPSAKLDIKFNFLVEYGAPRATIHKIVEDCLLN